MSALLTACGSVGDIETPSIATATEYIKEKHDIDVTDVILMEQFYEEEDVHMTGIDGAVFTKTIPAQTKTCYRAYSPDNDMYFFIYHNTETKHYYDNLTAGKMYVKQANEKLRWAEEFFGDDFIGAAVQWILKSEAREYEYKPIYDRQDADAKAGYNKLITELEAPYKSESRIYGWVDEIELRLETRLCIYVTCSLAELTQRYGEDILKEQHDNGNYDLIYASDGVYNSDHLNE